MIDTLFFLSPRKKICILLKIFFKNAKVHLIRFNVYYHKMKAYITPLLLNI